jgi:hemoglobin
VTLFERIGPDELRATVADFYERIVRDVMIGFMFAGKDKQQLIDREYELIAALLGAKIKYTGRPMRTAHAQHTIFGGQFERRMQLLREVFADRGTDPDVARAWLDHAESLRSQITRDRGSECADPTTSGTTKLAMVVPAPDPEKPIKLGRR